MNCFITRKKDKISTVFETVGADADVESFIAAFKQMYSNDWILINERWQLEEVSTPPGKKSPYATSLCVHEKNVQEP